MKLSNLAVFLCAGALWAQQPAAPQAPAPNPVKQALREGRIVVGTTITAGSPDVAAYMASAGFDFLWIEMEHSPLTLEDVRAIILATRGLKAMPFTRVPVNEPWLAKRVMDIGSVGVIFPFTASRELAQQAVQSVKYPPQGVRGFSPGLAASRWGMSIPEYVKWANENILAIPIIEQKVAVEHIDEIASVPGIDVLFIGVNDLSFSLGVGGQLEHPLVQDAVAKILAAGRKYKIPVGYPAGSPAEIKKRIAQGFRFFQASSDLGLMQQGARQLLGAIGAELAKPAPTVY